MSLTFEMWLCMWGCILLPVCCTDNMDWRAQRVLLVLLASMESEQHSVTICRLKIMKLNSDLWVLFRNNWKPLTDPPQIWQESPPAWTQEAYCPPRSKCSLCWSVSGGDPIPCLGGTPSHVRGGYPIPGLEGVIPSQVWGVPRSRGREYPSHVQGGLSRPGMGYPPLPLARPGMGYPPRPEILRWGTSLPPASVDRYTDWCQNITFPRTTYADGKYHSLDIHE